MSFKSKHDKAEQTTDSILEHIRNSRYSVVLVALVFLLLVSLFLLK